MASRKAYLARNIEDVDVTGVDNNDSLVWDSGDGKWKPVAISGGGGGVTDFTDLGDVPANYTAASGLFVRVSDTEDALEFEAVAGGGATDFTDLGDVPASYGGEGGKLVAVNTGENALEFVASGVYPTAFLGLGDTPASYSGEGEKFVKVNVGEDALEFVASGGGGASVFTDLTDVPASYAAASGKYVRVNDIEDTLIFDTPAGGGGASAFLDLSDTPSSFSGQAGKSAVVNDGEDALEFVTISGGGGGGSIASKSVIVTNQSVDADAHTTQDTWENIVAASGFITLEEEGDLDLDFLTVVQRDDTNWQHIWLRFALDTPEGEIVTPAYKREESAGTTVGRKWLLPARYVFSGMAAGDYTARAQWNDGNSNLNVTFLERQISIRGTWDVTAGGGASAFTDLSDVPSSYFGQAGKVPVVNAGETALEFLPTVASGVLQGYARAIATVGQTITTSATIFDWDSVTTDPDSTITAGAAWKWTAPYDCYVIISTSIGMQGTEEMVGEFLVNDAIVETFQKSSSGGTWNTANAEFIYKADADDYINVTIKRGTGSDRATALNWSHIDIYYVQDLTSFASFLEFTALNDTPANYTAASGLYLRVNDTEDAIIFEASDPGEGHITIFPNSYSGSGGSDWDYQRNQLSLYDWYFRNASPGGVQNDYLEYKVYLAAGTYTLMLIHHENTMAGIANILIDDVSVGSIDMYGTLTWNVRTEVTDIVVSSSGLKTLKFLMDTKNGSSSAYTCYMVQGALYRTA